MAKNIADMTAVELAKEIREGRISPVDAVDASLKRLEERDRDINAFVTVLEDQAREAARKAEEAVEKGEDLGPLHGVPVAVKDLEGMKKGTRHTFGSELFSDYVSPRDGVVVERLESAGAIIIGKTNTPELGFKCHTSNNLVGTTTNPFDNGKSAGGSSGGSAAAVGAGLVPLAQGSDGAGSIRNPAAMCGVVGLKPTPGVCPNDSRPNAYTHFHPYLHIGPIARTVEDLALMLDVLSGYYAYDPRSLPDRDEDYIDTIQRDVSGLRVAYSPDLDVFPVEETVRNTVADAAESFEAAGSTVEEVSVGIEHSLEELRTAWEIDGITSVTEMAETLQRESPNVDFLGDDREDVSPGLVDCIEKGYEYSAMEMRTAGITKTDLFDALQTLFETYDILITPTIGVEPFDKDLRLGPSEIEGREIDPWLDWTLTWPFNVTPHPAISVPAGFTDNGLPVGLQIVGRPHEDDTVLAAAAAFERERPWHEAYP